MCSVLNSSSKPYLQFHWQLEGIPFDRSIFSERILFQNETYNFSCKLQYGTLLTLSVVESPNWTDITGIVCTVDKVFCFVMDRDKLSKTLWKLCFDVNVDRSCTLTFRVHLMERVLHYKHQLVDSLFSDHLWEAAQNKFMTDIDFFVEGKHISAHRAVLDARCPALLISGVKLIEDVSADTFSTLLHFIYTGQLDKAPSRQLCQLADKCYGKLSALLRHCSTSFENNQDDLKPLSTFGSKSGKIVRSLTGVTLKCTINFSSNCPHSQDFEFHGQYLFTITTTSDSFNLFSHLFGGLKVNEVFFRRKLRGCLTPMNSIFRSNGIQEFRADFLKQNFSQHFPIYLEVYVLPNMPKFEFKLTDTHLAADLWNLWSAQKEMSTDLKLVIEDQTFLAHRAILAARSVYFANMFTSGMTEAQTGTVTIPDAPAHVFEHLLRFLYTGRVPPSADFKELLIIADKYQIDSLVSLCEANIGSRLVQTRMHEFICF